LSRDILYDIMLIIMAPLPKKKHSTQRKGKRLAKRVRFFSKLVKCGNCAKTKLAHRICKYCNKWCGWI